MAIKPILFNTEMVRAILDGRKSCTRRLVKFLSRKNSRWTGYIKDGLMLYNGKNEPCIRKAPYQPGDILYVRETFAWCPCWDCGLNVEKPGCEYEQEKKYNNKKKEHGCYVYRASCEDNEYPSADTWHPSIHMPKEAARIWLKVTDVRVQRLQDMDKMDAVKEGIDPRSCISLGHALMKFKKLWNSTIKKSDLDSYGWDANPWVWVIEFERCEKPKGV
nr:MAG TPA: ASCH domain protein [Caudoviricetes sp.]